MRIRSSFIREKEFQKSLERSLQRSHQRFLIEDKHISSFCSSFGKFITFRTRSSASRKKFQIMPDVCNKRPQIGFQFNNEQ